MVPSVNPMALPSKSHREAPGVYPPKLCAPSTDEPRTNHTLVASFGSGAKKSDNYGRSATAPAIKPRTFKATAIPLVLEVGLTRKEVKIELLGKICIWVALDLRTSEAHILRGRHF